MNQIKNNIISITGILILLTLTFNNNSYSQDRKFANIFQDFPDFINRLLDEWHVPGTAVGVVKDGQIIYLKGFGYRDIENNRKVNEQTLFCIGSCTKAFTSLSVAMLVDEGRFDWDTPIVEYFPDFMLYDDYVTRRMPRCVTF